MAPPTRTPRSAWIDRGLEVLARSGPDAVRVDALAKDLGVTRGGFYHHFKDRQALLDELLDAYERSSVDAVTAWVDQDEGLDPRERVRRLFAAAKERPQLLALDLAVRDWARRDDAVFARLRRVDDRRMAYLRDLFAGFVDDPDEVEARALTVASLWIGERFFVARHRPAGRTREQVVQRVLRDLLR
jgi:AcrR family transcriptional regulator